MNTKAVNIAVIEGKTITEATELLSNPQGQPVRIKAVTNGKYILTEGDNGLAPENIISKRVGKDLYIALEGTDPYQPQVIIEGFFDTQGQLVGVAEDGNYYEYISSDADQTHSAAFLMEGVPSPQILEGKQLSGFDGLVAGAGMGWFWPALLGFGALAVRGVSSGGGNNGSSGYNEANEAGAATGTLSNNIADGSITNDNAPTFSGTAEAGSTVIIYNNNIELGRVTVDINGNWTFNPGSLDDGTHSFHTVVEDAGGNLSAASTAIDFTVDTGIPDAATATLSDNITEGGTTNENAPTFSGTAEIGTTVIIYNNNIELDRVTVNETGSWSYIATLDDGTYSFHTVVEDAGGNLSAASTAICFTVDTGIPDAATGSLSDNITHGGTTNENAPTFSGTAEADSTVIIYNGSTELGRVTVNKEGNWIFNPDALTDGPHSFHTVVEDAGGNLSAASTAINFTVDTGIPDPATGTLNDDVTPGTGTIIDGGITNDKTPTFSGTAEIGTTVIIYDGSTELARIHVNTPGNWTYTTAPLTDGIHSFHTVVEDAAGNQSPASAAIGFTVDTIAPVVPTFTGAFDNEGTIPILMPNGSSIYDLTPTLSGTGEVGSKIYVQYGLAEEPWEDAVAPVTVGPDGTWTWTTPTLSYDTHWEFRVRSQDTAGNFSGYTAKFHLYPGNPTPVIIKAVDDVGAVTGDVLNNGRSDDTTPTLHGTAKLGTTVYIQYGKAGATWQDATSPVTVGSDGTWSWTAPTLDPGYIWEFRAKIVDEAGIQSHYTSKFLLTVGADNTSFTDTDEVNFLQLSGADEILDLTALTDSYGSIEKIDITGTGNNTVKLSLDDVLSHGMPNLFIDDNSTQIMINGNEGDVVELQGLIGAQDPGTWTNEGPVTVAGVIYDVYHHSLQDAELLVQQGVTTHLNV